MDDRMLYQLLADLVLAFHVAVVLFVVVGLVLIIVGGWRAWRWVGNRWFRLVHLAAIAVVVGQAWFGMICPLTTLEMRLRVKAHSATYEGSFIEYWLQQVLYYDAPAWVFGLMYTVFGLAVLAAWRYVPPRRRRDGRDDP